MTSRDVLAGSPLEHHLEDGCSASRALHVLQFAGAVVEVGYHILDMSDGGVRCTGGLEQCI
jgi:hypothetical protein